MKNWALAACVALTGCGGWARPNTTEQEFYQDRYQCQMEAAQAYPVAMNSVAIGQGTPSRTTCTTIYNQMNCTTQPGTTAPTSQFDMNAGARSGAISSCLRARGYAFQRR